MRRMENMSYTENIFTKAGISVMQSSGRHQKQLRLFVEVLMDQQCGCYFIVR